jgi:hypothetical protein
MKKVKATQTLNNEEIRLPGEHGADLYSHNLEESSLDMPQQLWEEINSL